MTKVESISMTETTATSNTVKALPPGENAPGAVGQKLPIFREPVSQNTQSLIAPRDSVAARLNRYLARNRPPVNVIRSTRDFWGDLLGGRADGSGNGSEDNSNSGGRGGPEGPPPPPDRENIWSPEHRKWGRSISREIIYLERLLYKDKYDPLKHPAKNPSKYSSRLDELYDEWIAWKARDVRRSEERDPRKYGKDPEKPEAASPGKEEQKKDNLEGLFEVTALYDRYLELLGRPTVPEEDLVRLGGQLSRYFNEAKRVGLLAKSDETLRSIYIQIMRGIKSGEPADEIGKKIEKRVKYSLSRSEKYFESRKRNRSRERPSGQLNKVWEVYVALAMSRFDLLLGDGANEPMEPFNIEGEFSFDIESFSFGTERSQEELRADLIRIGVLQTDDQLRARINITPGMIRLTSDAELRKLAGGSDERFEELKKNRDTGDGSLIKAQLQISDLELLRLAQGDEDKFAAFKKERDSGSGDAVFNLLQRKRDAKFDEAVKEQQEAIRNLSGDREAYRQLTQDRNIHWHPTYSNYFEVTASTKEEFEVAVETFTQWIRSGLTKSPNEIFQRVTAFKDALTTAGDRVSRSRPDAFPENFIVGLKQELEGLVAVLGADFSNEHYVGEHLSQFMQFLTDAGEGRPRMARLFKASRGRIASIMWKFDNDPRFDIIFNPNGSRGQLMKYRSAIEMKHLQRDALDLLIEETMAVAVKDYDPHHPERGRSSKNRDANINNITKNSSDEEFQDLYEGFDSDKQDEFEKSLQPKLERIKMIEHINSQLVKGKTLEDLTDAERESYAEYKAKMDHLEEYTLTEYEQKFLLARGIQEKLQNGLERDDLTREERVMYDEAKHAVDMAYELYGVMGQKATRGAGAFIVDRKKKLADGEVVNAQGIDIIAANAKYKLLREKFEIPYSELPDIEGDEWVDYIPVDKAQKFVTFAENLTKAIWGGEFDEAMSAKFGGRKGVSAAWLVKKVGQARKMALWALKRDGFDAKLFDFTLYSNGQIVDLETHLGVDPRMTKPEQQQPLYPNILGFSADGKPVTLTFDDEGRPVGIDFDEGGNAIVYNRPAGDPARQIIKFDNLKKDMRASKLMLKTPEFKKDANGVAIRELVNDSGTDRFIPVLERPVDLWATFEVATSGISVYERTTQNPYFGYQEEDLGRLMTPEVYEAALRIQRGESRYQDEPLLAQILLVINPSLSRLEYIWDKEERTDSLFAGAVEESFLSGSRISDQLHQVFMPDGAGVGSARTAYVIEDFGGVTKELISGRLEAARWSNRFVRRLKTFTPNLPSPFKGMVNHWATGTTLNVVRMMSVEEYPLIGQTTFEKWVSTIEAAIDLYEAEYGFRSKQEKRSREGLGEKPFNEADDVLLKFLDDITTKFKDNSDPSVVNIELEYQILKALRDSWNRFEIVLQRLRVLTSDVRGEKGPRNLEGKDVFLRHEDGSFVRDAYDRKLYNHAIDKDSNVGTSRHLGSILFWRFVRWATSHKDNEGGGLYNATQTMYDFMYGHTTESRLRAKAVYDEIIASGKAAVAAGELTQEELEKIANDEAKRKLQTRFEWLEGKQNR